MVEGDLLQVKDIIWRDFLKLLWRDVGLSFIKFDLCIRSLPRVLVHGVDAGLQLFSFL